MEHHIYEDMNRLESSHWWFLARREILADVVARHVPKRGSILDVGCGTGFVLQRLRDDYDVHGLEPAQVAVDFCREKGLPNVHRGELADAEFGRRDFHMVSFLDVIEHLDDDVGALKLARQYLRDDGLLLVTVPAFQMLWSEHDVVHHHRRRYTREMLEAAVVEAGYEPVDTTYFNTVLFPMIFAARMAGKVLGKSSASDAQALPSKLVNKLLYGAFVSEKALLPQVKLPFGVSLLCVARKRTRAAG